MAKESFYDSVKYIFGEVGLKSTRKCYLNYRFLLALLAGVIVVWVMHGWVKPYPSEVQFSWLQLLSLIIWQPLVEEVLFRGIIQGQFARREWGRRSWLGISSANLLASILFVAIHMVNSPPLFALTVMAPSLVFGYFRDYCNSVYPSIIIHSAYNAMVFAGLILSGNMDFPSF
ncbi:MAG: JDVT-CTERM system CAAX-type protease [Gammaproteobacteria bacterium]|nr:JDVT-CTERM system CAAX-type protease [Gammaproteobacteria bacterium]NNJ48833.1 JDVT-CTERM system CAAX-type protease [Gammaproteobacteria bacterium]